MIFDAEIKVRIVTDSEQDPREIQSDLLNKLYGHEKLEPVLGDGYKVVHNIINVYHIK